MKAELEAVAALSEQTGSWLASAMEGSWAMAEALLAYPQLADLLAERHKIVGNNWQSAFTAQLIARCLRGGVSIVEPVDFSPTGLREDLAGARSAPRYLYSAAELISHAADLSAASSVLTHEDERRWPIFRERIEQITLYAVHEDGQADGRRPSASGRDRDPAGMSRQPRSGRPSRRTGRRPAWSAGASPSPPAPSPGTVRRPPASSAPPVHPAGQSYSPAHAAGVRRLARPRGRPHHRGPRPERSHHRDRLHRTAHSACWPQRAAPGRPLRLRRPPRPSARAHAVPVGVSPARRPSVASWDPAAGKPADHDSD